MLLRYDTLSLYDNEARNIVREASVRAYAVRLWIADWIHSITPTGDHIIPSCHVVAHAFARTFGYEAIDGEHAYICGVKTSRWFDKMRVDSTTMLHSWVELETAKKNRFILDIFPDEGCSIFPVLYRAPHPAYWIPADRKRAEVLRGLVQSAVFQSEVDQFSSIMREATVGYFLTSPEQMKQGPST